MSKAALSVLAFLLPGIAAAQPIQGLYLSGGTGVNFAGSLQSSQTTTEIDTNPCPLGLAAIGWGFGNGLHAEIEGSYRSNGISGISTRRVNGLLEPLANVGGNVATRAIMTNLVYDIPLRLPVTPYVGAGLGYGWLNFNNAGGNGLGRFLLPQNNIVTAPDTVTFGSSGAFAYQAIVGAALPLRILPGLQATLEYRFFGTAHVDVPVSRVALGNNPVNGAIPSSRTRNGLAAHDNAIMIGVRYTFGTPRL